MSDKLRKFAVPIVLFSIVFLGTVGSALAQPAVGVEELKSPELVRPTVGIPWMEIWASYWWIIAPLAGFVIGLIAMCLWRV